MRKLFAITTFCLLSTSGLLLAQGRRLIPAPPPARHYEIRPGPRREELSKRLEQRRMELRREDKIRDRRRVEPPRGRGRR